MPPFFSLQLPDGDGDSIPDLLEQFFSMDPGSASDAGLVDSSGYTYAQRYLCGQNLNNEADALQEWMEDFIPNLWKMRYGFDLLSPAVWNEDPDGDAISNLMEYLGGTDPLVADLLDPEHEEEQAAQRSARFQAYLAGLGLEGVDDRDSGAAEAAAAAALPVIEAKKQAEKLHRQASLAKWGEVQIVTRAAFAYLEVDNLAGTGSVTSEDTTAPAENVEEPEMESVPISEGDFATMEEAQDAYNLALQNNAGYPLSYAGA